MELQFVEIFKMISHDLNDLLEFGKELIKKEVDQEILDRFLANDALKECGMITEIFRSNVWNKEK